MKRRLAGQLAVWVLGAAVLRIAVVPPETCPAVDAAQVRTAIREAASWLERGLGQDGRYTYAYHMGRDEVSNDYSLTRHAGVVMALYQLAVAGDDSFVEAADAGLGFALDNLIEHDGWVAFAEPGRNHSLGASSLLVAALAQRRRATGDTSHDDLMRSLSRFLVVQQQSDGSMLASWSPFTGKPVPNDYSRFSTGEAFWALGLMHDAFPDDGWDVPTLRVADYLATRRDRAEGYVVRVPDHWAAHGLAELSSHVRLSEDHITYARKLAGFFGVRIRMESQRTGRGVNLLVRWYPGTPSGVGTAGEGLGSLWRLSENDARLADLRPNLAERIACTSGMMVERQIGPGEAALAGRPHLARGAWFYRGYSQMDDQQHSISAMLLSLPAFEFLGSGS
ncbi:MAG: hypothetical protein ACE5KX_00520 [Acidimicrobiia bacterium]